MEVGYRVRFKDNSLSHAVQMNKDAAVTKSRNPKSKVSKAYSGSAPTESGKSGSKSKYQGGFIFKNNRMNNSKAYNHDYYMHNKDKWNKDKSTQKMGGFISTFFAVTLSTLAYMAIAVATTAAVDYLINQYSKWKTRDIPLPKTAEDKKKEAEAAEKKEQALVSTNRLFKYKYKVVDLFGKVRYFYTQAAYDRYCIGLKQKTEPCTIQEDIDAINPGYKTDRANSDENCAYCTLAYDLRRKGYDVTAINEDDDWFAAHDAPTLDEIKNWYTGETVTAYQVSDETRSSSGSMMRTGKIDSKSSAKETERLFNTMASQGEGAGGFFTAYFRTPDGHHCTGHAMAYQVINNEAYIIDTQNGKVMNQYDFANSNYAERIVWGTNDRNGDEREPWINIIRTDSAQLAPGTTNRVKNADGSPTTAYADDERIVGPLEYGPALWTREEIERKSK